MQTPNSNGRGEAPRLPSWGSWEYGEYGEGAFFFVDPLKNPVGKYPLMTATDDEELEQTYPTPELAVRPETEPPTPMMLARLVRRHRLLVLFYSRARFFVPAGHFGLQSDIFVHGAPFQGWCRISEPYVAWSSSNREADDLLAFEQDFRRFFAESAAVAFRGTADATDSSGEPLPKNPARILQRRGWVLHALGRQVVGRSAALMSRCVAQLELDDVVTPAVLDYARAIVTPTFLEGGNWEKTESVPWSYLEAFTPVIELLGRGAGNGKRDAGNIDNAGSPACWVPAVVLSGPDLPPRVFGHPVPKLTRKRYALIKAIVEGGTSGLTKKVIEGVTPGAREMLKEIRRLHPLWDMAILRPVGTDQHYRIAAAW